MFADNLVKKAIGEIIENKKDILDNEAIWYQMTKCLIRNGKLGYILDSIEKINEELADMQWFENKYPTSIFKEKKEKIIYKSNNKLRDLINTKLKITDVAKSYGLDTDKKGITTCPFHYDTSPSLHLENKRNIFHCFGCGAKGDIIIFIKKMEEMKSGGDNKERCRAESD